MEQFRGTTIVSVRRDGKVAIAGDGQAVLDALDGDFVISVKTGQTTVRKGQASAARRTYADDETKGNHCRSELTLRKDRMTRTATGEPR